MITLAATLEYLNCTVLAPAHPNLYTPVTSYPIYTSDKWRVWATAATAATAGSCAVALCWKIAIGIQSTSSEACQTCTVSGIHRIRQRISGSSSPDTKRSDQNHQQMTRETNLQPHALQSCGDSWGPKCSNFRVPRSLRTLSSMFQ